MTDINSAPDSWEAAADEADTENTANMISNIKLNVNAPVFIPNVNAPEFVPSFMMKQPQSIAPGQFV